MDAQKEKIISILNNRFRELKKNQSTVKQYHMKPKKFCEIIKCSCGVTFAACAEGHQDKEWHESKIEYLGGGCTALTIHTEDLDLRYCDCPKTAKEKAARQQLQMF